MIAWRTSSLVLLFLSIMATVVVFLAVAEVRGSRDMVASSVGGGFSLRAFVGNITDRFNQPTEDQAEGDPRVAGAMIEPKGPRFPVTVGEGDAHSPFVPAPKPGGPDTTPPVGEGRVALTSGQTNAAGSSTGTSQTSTGTVDSAEQSVKNEQDCPTFIKSLLSLNDICLTSTK